MVTEKRRSATARLFLLLMSMWLISCAPLQQYNPMAWEPKQQLTLANLVYKDAYDSYLIEVTQAAPTDAFKSYLKAKHEALVQVEPFLLALNHMAETGLKLDADMLLKAMQITQNIIALVQRQAGGVTWTQ